MAVKVGLKLVIEVSGETAESLYKLIGNMSQANMEVHGLNERESKLLQSVWEEVWQSK